MRPAADYLSPWLARDVIETPLDAVLDVGGWDVRKALQLLVKGNATVLEWLRSPIAYDVDPRSATPCSRWPTRWPTATPCAGTTTTWPSASGSRWATAPASLKRVFYALRPAVTLRWLREHPGSAVPPMDLPTLMAQVEVADDVRAAVDEAVARKAVTRELGTGDVPAPLLALVDDELGRDDDLPGPARPGTGAGPGGGGVPRGRRPLGRRGRRSADPARRREVVEHQLHRLVASGRRGVDRQVRVLRAS